MKYNIYYELTSVFFVFIILIYHSVLYTNKSGLNKRFQTMVYMVLVSSTLDIISAFTISYYDRTTIWLNILINASYYMVSASLAFLLTCYVRNAISKAAKTITYRINQGILVAYIISLIANVFAEFYFGFDSTGMYFHGPLYGWHLMIPLYYIVYPMSYLFRFRKQLTKKKFVSISLYLLLTLVGFCIQLFICPDVLLTGFAAALAILVLLFSLETPDYEKLIATMKELEEAKTESEKERRRADMANQAKSMFLANVSHEVRTPINAIIGMNEMILRECKEEKTKEYALDIKDSSYTLLGMVNEVLDASKIENGKLTIIQHEYHLDEMLEDLLEPGRRWAAEKNLKLFTEIQQTLPVGLYGDDKRIKQVIMNLITNAIKYTQTGSITIRLSGTRDGENILLHIEVQDTGIGIKKENFDRLFIAFERIEDARNLGIDGTGLGLNISEKILKMMDSGLKVQSEYGKGSCFSFDLMQKVVDERILGDSVEDKKKETSYEYQAKFITPDKKVLVVDDSIVNLKVFCNLLKKTQIQITTAESGKECLKLIAENYYDIIFLDHMMPEMDGMETLKQMKIMENNLCRETPVIMLTANALMGAREKYLEAGFQDFLPKPIIPEYLEEIIFRYIK